MSASTFLQFLCNLFSAISWSSFIQLLRDLSPVISWIIIFYGWRRATAENDQRQLRKEMKERIEAVQKLLSSLEDKAKIYFTSSPCISMQSLSTQIKQDIASIAHLVGLMKEIDHDYDCSKLVLDLRKSITGGTFDSTLRIAIADDDEVIKNIADKVVCMHRHLDRQYIKK